MLFMLNDAPLLSSLFLSFLYYAISYFKKKKEKEIGEKIGEKLERKEGIDKEEEEEELINEK